MQNEVSMGDLMNAIKTLEANNNHSSQVLDDKFTKSTQNLEARLNSTTGELMQAIKVLDNKIEGLDSKFTQRFNQTDSEIVEIHEAIQILASDTDQQIMIVRNQMVTKDYLDEKIGGLRGDMIQRIRTGLPKLAL